MDFTRPYYEDIQYKPNLFYVVFGVSEQEPVISRSRHHVSEFPAGLDLHLLTKAEHAGYMENLTGGAIRDVLRSENADLYEKCVRTERWAVIKGRAEKDDSLEYFRNVIGIIQALIDQGACGVMDLYTFTMLSAQEWTDTIFAQEFDPWRHASILVSEEPDGFWLHTRGMIKFGRPDISMKKIRPEKIDEAGQLINQMIWYGAQGVFFRQETKLHIRDGRTFTVTPKYIADFENDDFNNAFYEVTYEEVC